MRSSDSDDGDAFAIDTSNTIYCLHVTVPPPPPNALLSLLLLYLNLASQSYIRKQKVQKSKTKFKVALKDGIMSLNGVE